MRYFLISKNSFFWCQKFEFLISEIIFWYHILRYKRKGIKWFFDIRKLYQELDFFLSIKHFLISWNILDSWYQKNPLYILIWNKRPMGHIAHLRNQFKSVNTFAQGYVYIITLIWRGKKRSTEWSLFVKPWVPKDALCQVLLKLAQWFWRTRF